MSTPPGGRSPRSWPARVFGGGRLLLAILAALAVATVAADRLGSGWSQEISPQPTIQVHSRAIVVGGRLLGPRVGSRAGSAWPLRMASLPHVSILTESRPARPASSVAVTRVARAPRRVARAPRCGAGAGVTCARTTPIATRLPRPTAHRVFADSDAQACDALRSLRGCSLLARVTRRGSWATHHDLAASITVRTVTAAWWCIATGRARPDAFSRVPCAHRVPPGFARVAMIAHHGRGSGLLVVGSFTARRAVSNGRSWYEYWIADPHGRGGSSGELGSGGVRAGQTLQFRQFEPDSDRGVYRGLVVYAPDGGPVGGGPGSEAIPGMRGAVVVGRFSFTVR